MIYEMYQFSQYSDGSVLDCRTIMYTAQEVVDGKVFVHNSVEISSETARNINLDLRRNAKAVLKNGTTKNLAPRT